MIPLPSFPRVGLTPPPPPLDLWAAPVFPAAAPLVSPRSGFVVHAMAPSVAAFLSPPPALLRRPPRPSLRRAAAAAATASTPPVPAVSAAAPPPSPSPPPPPSGAAPTRRAFLTHSLILPPLAAAAAAAAVSHPMAPAAAAPPPPSLRSRLGAPPAFPPPPRTFTGGTADDLVYPPWLAGTWAASSVVVAVDAPSGVTAFAGGAAGLSRARAEVAAGTPTVYLVRFVPLPSPPGSGGGGARTRLWGATAGAAAASLPTGRSTCGRSSGRSWAPTRCGRWRHRRRW